MAIQYSPAINRKSPFSQASDVLNDIWDFSVGMYKSPIYKANVSLLKSIASFQSLVEHIFSNLPQMPEVIEYLSKMSCAVISASSKTVKDISGVFKFIFLYKYPKKIQKVYKQLKKALERGDRELIIDSSLNVLALIGKCCSIPKTIYKFMGDYTPDIITGLTGPLGNISDIFSIFSLVSKKFKLDATNKLMEELKFAKYSKFLEGFDHTSSVALKALSVMDLRERVRSIKKIENSDRIEEITLIANKAFLKALTKKISENSKIVKTHFKISESKQFIALLKQGKKEGTDLKKSKAMVKNIKLRLDDKIFCDKCSIFTSVCGISSMVVGKFKAFGIAYAPLTLVMTGVSCISSFVSANITFYEYQRKKEFLKAMRIAPAA